MRLSKRPYNSTQHCPAQLKEVYGKPDEDNWLNKIFWGDNLQVISHLLKEYRGKVDLIYIDPPFDSKADYKKKISIKGKKALGDNNIFEEKQYGDIWTNNEYLQFMYERLVLLRELLSDKGSIYLHCDWRKSHHLRMLMDEVFGENNFRSAITWDTSIPYVAGFKWLSDNWIYSSANIFYYTKTSQKIFNKEFEKVVQPSGDISEKPIKDIWTDIENFAGFLGAKDYKTGYPTQKPEALLKRIIEASTNPGDIVFDCFMGSGTTQAVAMKLRRRFIGADINLGAIQTTIKRLNNILKENERNYLLTEPMTGFEVYNVNNYDLFRNPLEARDLLIEALNIRPFSRRKTFDGELDGRNVKIMPVNRIATKADLKELIANLPYSSYDKRKEENPKSPVDNITLVCMGHEPDLATAFKQEVSPYNIDIQIVDILTDKKDFKFKKEAKANIIIENDKLIIKSFYPMNLMQKLSLQKEHVDDYKQLVDSVVIDWNYDGKVLRPETIDIPGKKDFVKGEYTIPSNRGRIRVKITDLLSESIEIEVA
jgi:site-specific DNA-methyltransferase (adenine-specific)